MAATLRLELFVNDLPKSKDFYGRILRFKIYDEQIDGYTPMENGEIRLSLNKRSSLPENHPIQAVNNERFGRGVEFVLEVDDIEQCFEYVQDQNWPISDTLQHQPWGLTDFRIIDPDGYYWRITKPA